MRSQTLILALSVPIAKAFAPPMSFRTQASSPSSKLSAIDPSSLHDVHQHVDTLHNFFSSLTLADLDADALSSSVPLDAAPGAPEVDAAAAAAADAAKQNGGWFGFLTVPIETLLQIIHGGIAGVVPGNAWGASIILMTVIIKALTFPLTKQQLESTNKMQVSVFLKETGYYDYTNYCCEFV